MVVGAAEEDEVGVSPRGDDLAEAELGFDGEPVTNDSAALGLDSGTAPGELVAGGRQELTLGGEIAVAAER